MPASALADGDWLVSLYRKALQHDPSVGVAAARLETARQDRLIARANLLPRLDANAGANYIYSSTYNYLPNGDVLQGDFFGYNYSIVLRQPIYNGQAFSTLASAAASVRSADATTVLSRQDLISQVAEAALASLKSRVLADYAEGERKRSFELLEYYEASLKEGTEEITNRNEGRARYEEANAQYVKADNERRIADRALAVLTGVPVSSLQVPKTVARRTLPSDHATADEWMALAEAKHPSIVRAKADFEAADLDVQTAERGHWPTLDFSGGFTVNKGSSFLPNVETRQWVTGLNLTVPLFAGLGGNARSDRARSVRSERSQSLEGVRDDLRRKIDSSFLLLENADRLIGAMVKRQASEQELLRSVEKKMSLGISALPERINAERRVAASSRDIATTHIDERIVWLRLRGAAGQLTEEDLKAVE